MMKFSIKHDLLFFLQYLIMIIVWYWLFRDSPVIRFIAVIPVVGYSMLMLVRPQWFPN